jgi:hypothetical protein
MSIVFLCPTGTYTSLVAANLLVGNLKVNCQPHDILNLPYFGNFSKKPGIFLYIGTDSAGNKVYTLGTGNEAKLIIKSAYDLVKIMSINPNELQLYDFTGFIPGYIWRLLSYSPIFTGFINRIIAVMLHRRLIKIDNEMKKLSAMQVL